MSLNIKISVLTLAIFALKFSYDSWDMKEELFTGYAKMRGLNMQWLGIFKTLPVGVIVAEPSPMMSRKLSKTSDESSN